MNSLKRYFRIFRNQFSWRRFWYNQVICFGLNLLLNGFTLRGPIIIFIVIALLSPVLYMLSVALLSPVLYMLSSALL